MTKKTLLFLIFATIFASFVSAQQNIDVSKLPTIQTTGTAEIQVVPDMASLSLRVSKTDKNLVMAKNQTDENIAQIITLAKRFNIAPTDVKTDYISVKEKYESVKEPGELVLKSVFVGYTVSKTVVVKLKDLSKFENFFSEIVKIGVSEIGDVEFESSELRKYKDEARKMAIRAAKEKAQALAKEIGQTIGKAVSIEENNIDGYRSPYSNVSSNTFSTSDSDDENVASFSVGTITVKAQVEVKFLLN